MDCLDGTGPIQPLDAILCEFVDHTRTYRAKCLRTERFKYVFAGTDRPVELFDLEYDPDELVNVADDPAYAAEVRRHAELLLDRLLRTGQAPWNTSAATRTAPALDGFGLPVNTGEQK